MLGTLDASDVTLIGGVVALFYAIIQIGNYLWGKKTVRENNSIQSQSHECALQHASIANQMSRVHELLSAQTIAQTNMSNALTALIKTTDQLATAAEYRHQQLLQEARDR